MKHLAFSWCLNGAITPKVFASSSPGFLPWDKQRPLVNYAGGVGQHLRCKWDRFARFPSVVATLQRWAEIRERLRRINLSESEELRTWHMGEHRESD
jgi:hypothetical protein